ncbi:MAG: DUF1553 domain-containing protein [Pirellulaceae bacterium]
MSSAVYRAAGSSASDDALQRDPRNRWLSHQNRKRLDFEATRDAILHVSGQLDPLMGGRSVKLSDVPYPTRRTVYAYVDRVELDPMLRVFDFATPTTSTAQRAVTTVPQQSLFVMNHPFVIQAARALAASSRRKADAEQSDARQTNANGIDVVRRWYRNAFAHDPVGELGCCSSLC